MRNFAIPFDELDIIKLQAIIADEIKRSSIGNGSSIHDALFLAEMNLKLLSFLKTK
jgi:hypothetical protein